MALIKCDGISIAYGGQTVVRDLSFGSSREIISALWERMVPERVRW